jgi:hypothetical protein
MKCSSVSVRLRVINFSVNLINTNNDADMFVHWFGTWMITIISLPYLGIIGIVAMDEFNHYI